MSVFTAHFLKGTHAARPAANTVPEGGKYSCSDHGLVYESDGVSTWSTWFNPGPGTDAEIIRDVIGAALVAGTGVTVTVNDAGDTITIASTSVYTDEQARDAIGAALVAGSGMTITVNDAADTITLASSGGGGGSGGNPWVNRLSLPLSTLTGWTVGGGTWTASGSGIRNADSGGAAHRARYTATRYPQGELVAEVDIKVDALTQGVNSRAGFLLNYPFGSDTTNSILVCLRGNAGNTAIASVYMEYEGVAAGPDFPLGSTIAIGATTTLRVFKAGGVVTVWVNGTCICTGTVAQGNLDAGTLAFYSWGTDVTFSNLDLWTPTMPDESSPSVVYPAGSADKPPTAPNAKDDEFDGSSTVTWTATPTAPNAFNINTTRLGNAYVKASGSGAALVGRYQSVPGAYPYTITSKMSGTGRANFHRGGGIFLAPAAPTNASTAYYLGSEVNSSIQCAAILETLGGSFVSHIPNVLTGHWGPIYMKFVVNSATSVDSYVSTDGWAWLPIQTAANPGFTPGVMGFCNNEEGSAVGVESFFEFFRVT